MFQKNGEAIVAARQQNNSNAKLFAIKKVVMEGIEMRGGVMSQTGNNNRRSDEQREKDREEARYIPPEERGFPL